MSKIQAHNVRTLEDMYESKKPQKMGKSKFFDDNSHHVKTKKTSRFLTKTDLKSFLKDED